MLLPQHPLPPPPPRPIFVTACRRRQAATQSFKGPTAPTKETTGVILRGLPDPPSPHRHKPTADHSDQPTGTSRTAWNGQQRRRRCPLQGLRSSDFSHFLSTPVE